MVICLLIIPNSLCFYALGRSAMFPGLKDVTLCRRCPLGPTVQSPLWAPKPDAPEVYPVWASCTILLWWGCNCCGHTGGWGYLAEAQAWAGLSEGCVPWHWQASRKILKCYLPVLGSAQENKITKVTSTSVSVPRESPSCPLPLQHALQD